MASTTFLTFFFSVWLITATHSLATRTTPSTAKDQGGFDFRVGRGRGGLDIPGFGPGGYGGYGGGYGGSSGGRSSHGVMRSTVECAEKGPCYKKKLRCPAKCFTSYSGSGKGYGYGGGGGGCTMDCKKKCIAYC